MINIGLDKSMTFALVGASNNKEKYGYQVLEDMLDRNFNVIPINLHEETILRNKVYPSLSVCPVEIDVVVFVVPPKVTLKVLGEVLSLGIKQVWFQPGSESTEAISFCTNNDIRYTQACIMKSSL
jgi:predicted CoA-binding protein